MLKETYPNESFGSGIRYADPAEQAIEQYPTLETVLYQQGPLPAGSVILGMCQDGLPLVLDMTNPESGAFLIAGDSGFDNTMLLHSIMTAAIKANRTKDVTLHLVSPHANDLLFFHHQPNFKISYEPHRPEIKIVLEEMVNLVLSRQHKFQPLPAQLFAIDGLDLLWQLLDAQSKLRLEFLIRQGPAVGFWVFASLEATTLADQISSRIDLFPSRILSRIGQSNLANYLSGLSRSYLTDLVPGLEYFVRTNGQSFNIWALPSEDLQDERI